MKNSDGTYVGFWGVMSDESRSFRPWTHQFTRGLYLAGVETYADAVAPEGWTKWVMPARKYIVVDVDSNRYREIFDTVPTTTKSPSFIHSYLFLQFAIYLFLSKRHE